MSAGRYGNNVDERLQDIIALFAADRPVPDRYQDHALIGV